MNQTKDNFLLKDFVKTFGVPYREDHPRVQENANKIEETFRNRKLPKKLAALSGGERKFEEKYIKPILGKDIVLHNIRLIHSSQGITGLGIVGKKGTLYINDMCDNDDLGMLLATDYTDRFGGFNRDTIFSINNILPVGNDTFLVVIQYKYPRIGGPYLERLHIIDIKDKKIINVPEEVGNEAQFIHYINDSFNTKGDKILITGELVKNIYTYLSECDDTRDMLESRSYRGASFYVDCEIDQTSGKITLVQ